MTERAVTGGSRAFGLDALAVSDRFRLFNFTRRDDHLVYLWVLRAMDRLRAVHQLQAHPDDVARVLAELGATYEDAPQADDNLRSRLDALAEDGVVHRLEDASRAGSLVRYRNRQSVYQFSELGYQAFTAVEEVLAARLQDANLSRLVFSDILEDLKALAAANRSSHGEQVWRRLSRLDTVMEDMARRSARFHLTLAEITRSTDASPETFLRHKNTLLAHMTDFMAELDRYLPRLDKAVREVEQTGVETMLGRAAAADERLFMGYDERLEDWRRRWQVLRAWFAADGGESSRAAQLRAATRTGVSGVIALLRQIAEAQRGGVNRSTQLRHLAEWVFNTPDEGAAHALMTAAFNARTARHLGGAHDDAEVISVRSTWWDSPGVEISVPLFRRGKAPTPGVPQPVRGRAGIRGELRRRQASRRTAEREAAYGLMEAGVHGRVLDEAETRVVLRLLTRAMESRTIVAGRLRPASGGNELITVRLVPAPGGSTVRTVHGALHLPGLRLDLQPSTNARAPLWNSPPNPQAAPGEPSRRSESAGGVPAGPRPGEPSPELKGAAAGARPGESSRDSGVAVEGVPAGPRPGEPSPGLKGAAAGARPGESTRGGKGAAAGVRGVGEPPSGSGANGVGDLGVEASADEGGDR
ncbi:TIGR02677 family protein [Sphaerisporangium fuscum]|uniref:TIGR02677 family protein n=1 Tax=Sphaerisporangium fuscum TaxID=2835868 RepID=UPI001BDC0BD0|nr:TIGR02677 family protein [Sphaerisporangium fuscum]